MTRARIITSIEDRRRYCTISGHELEPSSIERQRPDELCLLEHNGDVLARCGLWWTNVPSHDSDRLGLVGHYYAKDFESSRAILTMGCEHLRERGCSLAVGPMDGSTWARYRLLTERGDEPVFFLEPDNPDDWPQHLTANGFTTMARYCTALCSDLTEQEDTLASHKEKIAAQNVIIRSLRMDQFVEELRRIHLLSTIAFAQNFLYSPINADDFVQQYSAIQRFVRPELVFLAERDGEPIGFLFALPDLMEGKRGQPITTVIAKSMAVHPDHRSIGLGGLLLGLCHRTAHELGYQRVIHALMHEDNFSRRISDHTAKIIRRYELYCRPLK